MAFDFKLKSFKKSFLTTQTYHPMKLLLYVLLALSIISCKKNKPQSEFTHEMVQKETISFALDSTTTFANANTQFYEKGDSSFIVTLDTKLGHINHYHIESQKLIKKQVILRDKSPNSIEFPISMDYINSDSIFIYGYQEGLYLLNKSGKINAEYAMGSSSLNPNPGSSPILGSSPIRHFKNKVYFTTFSHKIPSNTLVEYDLKSGKNTFHMPYPDYYDKDLLINYYNSWSSLDEESGKLAVSFSLEDSLHILDLESLSSRKINASSKHFSLSGNRKIDNSLKVSRDLKKN